MNIIGSSSLTLDNIEFDFFVVANATQVLARIILDDGCLMNEDVFVGIFSKFDEGKQAKRLCFSLCATVRVRLLPMNEAIAALDIEPFDGTSLF